jgi:succinate dehydrogenase / fumarate reductase cytochrome b subunit
MSTNSGFISSTVGRKFVMALTGLFLVIFLIVHLSVNLTLFLGPESFNAASHFMGHNPIIQAMQIVLAAGFIYHIWLGIVITLQNRKARGNVSYAVNKWSEHTPFNSRTMIYSGVLVLLFLVLHMGDYFVPMKKAQFNHEPMDHYEYVIALFNNPVYVIIYVLAFVVLAVHLSHGVQSAFQSAGLRHGKYMGLIQWLGKLFFWLIGIGFSAIAIWFGFIK